MSTKCTAAAAAKSLQSCLTLCDPIDGSPPHSHSWDSAGKNTGVGCHFLLRCMKVKSESKVAQSCPTLSDPMDCSLPGSSTHGIFQAKVLEWGAIAFSGKTLSAFSLLILYSKAKFACYSRCFLTSYFCIPVSCTTTTTKSLQPCPALCDPIDGSPPGSPVPGILQARTLEWVAISFSNV